MSETAYRETTPDSAARLGGELRARRQSLGWGLPELSQSLRIRQAYLEAIEAGRMADLPGPTYALGFIRAYASALGLNGEMIAGRFRAEATEATMRPALSFPAPVPQRGVPAGALMLLGLLILGGTYAGWYYVSEHQRTPAQTVPPIPDRLLPAAEKPTPSPQVATILPTAAPPAGPGGAPVSGPALGAATAAHLGAPLEPQATPGAASVAGPRPASPAPPAATAPAPAQAAGPVVATAAPTATAPATQAAPTTPAVAAPATAGIVVRATADAWVTVKQPNGPPLLNKLMHAGDSWPVPASPAGLTLTTGNAGGTALDVDGTPIANLGGSGAVRRDLKLDANALKSGPLPPIPHGRAKVAPVPASQG